MNEQLMALAQIAIAIAGFSGVAVAITRDSIAMTYFDKANVWFIFVHSVNCFICTQVYLVLSVAYSPQKALAMSFQVLSVLGTLAILGALFSVYKVFISNALSSAMSTIIGKLIVLLAVGTGLVASIFAILNSVGTIKPEPSVYIGLNSLVLLLALLHFAYFISISLQHVVPDANE